MDLTVIDEEYSLLEISDQPISLTVDAPDEVAIEIADPADATVIEVYAGLKGDPGAPGSGGGGGGTGTVNTVNGKSPDSNGAITLAASDVGAKPSSYVPAWGEITSKPSAFTPSAHTHPISEVTSLQSALDAKAPLASPTFTGTVSGITKAMVGLGNVDNTTDASKPISTATQSALDLKAPLASPTFTGTVSGITKSMVGLANVDNTSDASKPVSTATQTALDAKAPTNHTHTSSAITDFTTAVQGIVNTQLDIAGAPATLDTLNELAAALGDDPNFATTVTNSIATKAPLASPTFTGTVSGITKSMVGLGNVDNTADSAKPVSSAQATAIAAKENAITAGTTSQYWRGDKTWVTLDKIAVGLANVDNTSDANKPVSTATATALGGKENTISAGLVSQYWRGDKTWQTLDKTSVGLANVDNTTDANKPISTATQTALNAKAPLASPTFTGTVSGITAAMVGAAPTSHTHAAADIVSGVIATARLGTGTASASTYLRGDGTWATVAAGGGATALSGLSDVTISSPVTANFLRYNGTAWANYAITKTDVGLGNVDNTSDLAKLQSTDANAFYNTGSSSYPTRASVTTDASRRVRWIGPVAPTIGGGYATSGFDVWENNA